jgi:signal transduction histidine kinase/CheY-like chemotaxis protein
MFLSNLTLKHLKFTAFFGILILSLNTAADSLQQKQIKIALTLNFIEYTKWPNEDSRTQLRVGVIESTPNISELFNSTLSTRKVRGLTLSVTRVTDVSDAGQFDLIYLADESTSKASEIYQAISGSQTLLVTVDGIDNKKTMINIVSNDDGSFGFEVNYPNIVYENLEIEKGKLLLLGGNEIDVVNLFRDEEKRLESTRKDLIRRESELAALSKKLEQSIKASEKSLAELEKTKQQLEKQKIQFEKQKKILQTRNIAIREKEGELVAVQDELKKTSLTLKRNNIELESREKQLEEQIKTIKIKEKEFKQLADSIESNVNVLSQQNQDIQQQDRLLEKQKESLLQQNILIQQQKNWLLFGAVAFGLFSLLMIAMFRFNRERKKSNQLLLERNAMLEKTRQELTEAIKEADKANQAKSFFLANMSHEIRTPMSAILGMIHLIASTRLSRKQSSYITKIENAAKSLLEIINDILDFSKVEAGELKVEEIQFELSDVLDNLSSIVGIQAQQKGLEFIYDIDAKIPKKLVGDPLRLGQILINLASNALKFTHQGEIIISISLLKQHSTNLTVEFSIQDTGIGMDQKTIGSLFKPFTQADSSTTRKFGGTGLGLAISKRLINQMGGEIKVESQPKNGSVFSFDINIKYQQESKNENSVLDNISMDKKRILIIEKNARVSDALKNLLQSFTPHINITPIYNVNNPPSFVKNNHFDLVFIDSLHNQKKAAEIRDYFLTQPGVALVQLLSNYQLNQINDSKNGWTNCSILAKPVTPSSVIDCLMDQFARKRANKIVNDIKDNSTSNLIELRNKLAGTHILLVDDNEINLEIAAEILAQAGVTVTTANDGAQGVNKAKTETFDLVLMDIQMPVMDGYEATELIRKHYNKTQLPIIAMTANAMSGDKEKCLATGMNDYVSKPIKVLEFFETLAYWKMDSYSKKIPNQLSDTDYSETSIDVLRRNKADELPQIYTGSNNKHINLDAGLELMQGNKKSYFRLLEKFMEQQSLLPELINQLIRNKDYTNLMKQAHSLKGVSGNLGMDLLSEYAGKVEDYCRNNENTDLINSSASYLSKELDFVLNEINDLDKPLQPISNDNTNSDASIEYTFKRLEQKIEQQDTESLQLIKYIITHYSDNKDSHILAQKIESALNNFDFSTAKLKLKELLSKK